MDTANGINYVTNASYAPHGALRSLTNGSNLVSTFYYNNRLQPCRISVKSGGTAPTDCANPSIGNVMDFTYNFDQDWGAGVKNNGNVASINNNRNLNRGQRFTYDELNRLKDAWTAGSLWGNSYVYDIWGNLQKKLACLAGSPCAGYPQGENLDQTADSKNRFAGFCYDAAGNLNGQSLCPNLTYTYDAENRLLSTAGVTYTYDGDGRRVKKSNGKLYWTGTGSEPLAETDLAGAIQSEFAFFNGKRVARRDGSGNTVFYYFSDHLGSASVLTDAAGTIVEESDYYPFGGERVITNNDPNAYKFTGKERDPESGLDFFGARYYSSSFGRYLSPDWSETPQPVPYADFSNPQTLNLYQYVGNNPITTFDTDGHCWPPSACADALDSFVQTFRQDGLATNDRTSSPTLAAINTFANGVVGDLASGAADVLRLGNGTAAAIDSAKQGDYAGAAVGLAQDGGRAAGVILTVVGLSPSPKGGPAPAAEAGATKPTAPVGNDLGLSSTTKTAASGKTTTTVTDSAGSPTYKTTPGKTGGQSTHIIRRDAQGNVKYVKQEARTNTTDFRKAPDHVHYKKPIDKVVK